MEVLNDFGINWFLLSAQVVNFLILVFILNKVLFKPLLKALEDRKQKIATSLHEADQIKAELTSAQKKGDALIREANQKADVILQEAKEAAAALKQVTTAEAREEAEKIMTRNQQVIQSEAEKMRTGLTGELMGLVVITAEKVLGRSLSDQEKEAMAKASLKELN